MDSSKPTIVLIHGAWADASSWTGVIGPLERAGFTVTAPPNNLRGLGADAAYVRAYLETISGPIVLVAHSYGGMVITNAAKGLPNVKALVYVDAFIPDEGQPAVGLTGAESALAKAATDPQSLFKLVPYLGAPEGGVDTPTRWPRPSPAASRRTCRPTNRRSSPPRSDLERSPASPSPRARRRGRTSRPGRLSAQDRIITPGHSVRWPRTPTRRSPRWTRPTCRWSRIPTPSSGDHLRRQRASARP
jgi:pimeloyl-ACP methyl ester carboxylesterase